MRTEYLEEFIAFSRHLSFSETAEELFIAKSTLSTHIANLERELGLKLIDRDNDNALTQEGALFLDGAKSALETLEGTVTRCTRFREEAAGRVRIACLTPTASLASLLSDRLDVPFQFVDREFREQPFAPLDTNRADIALLCDFSHFPRLVDEALARGLAYRPARPFPAVIAMMASHPLAAKRQLSRDDLVGASIMTESMLAYEHDRILIDRMLGADLHLSYAPGSMQSFSDLLIADFGTALYITPKATASLYCARRDDVVLVDRLDGAPFGFPLVVAWRADADPRVIRAAETIHACLKELEQLENLAPRDRAIKAAS